MPPKVHPAILGTFIVEEEHTGGPAVGMRVLLASEDDARKTCLIRDNHPQRAVGLDDIDPLDVDLFEVSLFRWSEAA
jgi:hypothetical protein